MIEAVADQVFIPLTVGGGVELGRRHPRAAQRRRRQGQHQHRGREQPRAVRRGVGALRRAVHRRRDRRQADARSTSGRSTSTAAARRPASTSSNGRARWRRCGAGEILLTSMDRDGARNGLRPRAHARGRRCRRRAGDRVRRRRLARSIWSTASRIGGADAVLAASIFHYGEFTVGAGEGGDGAPPASRCADEHGESGRDATGSTRCAGTPTASCRRSRRTRRRTAC